MLLENQAKQLVVEASSTAGASISDTNNFSGTGAQWAGVALPLVRKVFGQIAAQEFVSVQPMNLPSGLVFYLDFQYGDAKAPFAAGSSLYGDASANFGNKAEGGLYGAGRYSYSINTHVSASTIDTASVSFQDVEYDSDYVVTGSLTKVVLTLPSIASVIDPLAVRSFTIVGSGATTANVLSQFTAYDSVNDELIFIVNTGSVNITEAATELGYS
jgi:hypothetical protein